MGFAEGSKDTQKTKITERILEREVQVPKYVEVPVERIRWIEKTEYITVPKFVEKIVEVPKYVEVIFNKFIIKEVIKEVIVPKFVEREFIVPKLVDKPIIAERVQWIDKPKEHLVEQVRIVQKVVEEVVTIARPVFKDVVIEKPLFRERIVEVIKPKYICAKCGEEVK
jgi:hypothetical protein